MASVLVIYIFISSSPKTQPKSKTMSSHPRDHVLKQEKSKSSAPPISPSLSKSRKEVLSKSQASRDQPRGLERQKQGVREDVKIKGGTRSQASKPPTGGSGVKGGPSPASTSTHRSSERPSRDSKTHRNDSSGGVSGTRSEHDSKKNGRDKKSEHGERGSRGNTDSRNSHSERDRDKKSREMGKGNSSVNDTSKGPALLDAHSPKHPNGAVRRSQGGKKITVHENPHVPADDIEEDLPEEEGGRGGEGRVRRELLQPMVEVDHVGHSYEDDFEVTYIIQHGTMVHTSCRGICKPC